VVIWNRGNERRLLALWEAGASCVAIAADLGCSSASVSWRVRQLGLKRGVAVAPAALFAASPVAPPPAAASKGHAA
jgi:DNA-binding CsgD family transcriptional regulator